MTKLRELFDKDAQKHPNSHHRHNTDTCARISRAHTGTTKSDETRANISAGAKKRWANTSVRYTHIAGAARRKAIMTPNGLYPSRAAAFRDLGVASTTLDIWMRKYPDQFYYVIKEV